MRLSSVVYHLFVASLSAAVSACGTEPAFIGTPTPLGQSPKQPAVSNAIPNPVIPFSPEEVQSSCNPFFPLVLGITRAYQVRHGDILMFHEQSIVAHNIDERFTLRADFFIQRPQGDNPTRRIPYHPSLNYDAESRCAQGRVEVMSYSFLYINEVYRAEGEYLPAPSRLLDPNSRWEYRVLSPSGEGMGTFLCKSLPPSSANASSATREGRRRRSVTILCTRSTMLSSPNLLAKFPQRYEVQLLALLGPTHMTLEYDEEVGVLSFDIIGKRTSQ